ncbi:hypothetical protein ACG04R_02845 [Roseateles sp. BYS78W]|uniref:Uncharacterized protein n=1 Tax=Pelomonas candidula TaxID=3299025 RepID=A0ABW7H6R6_9BURK
MRRLLAFALAFHALGVMAQEPAPQELAKLRQKLMAETQVNARMGIDGPVAKFKSDGNPDTLEIVFLDKPDPDANTVSEDGEVIFLYKASDEVQTKLIGKAFELKARLRLAASSPR